MSQREGGPTPVAHHRHHIRRLAVAHEKDAVELGDRLNAALDFDRAAVLREEHLFTREPTVDRQVDQRT